MTTVRVADLKARLSAHLRSVRRGRSLTVLDRDTPVARPVPFAREAETLTVRSPRPGAPRLHRIPLPPRLRVGVDIIALLDEERQQDRRSPMWTRPSSSARSSGNPAP